MFMGFEDRFAACHLQPRNFWSCSIGWRLRPIMTCQVAPQAPSLAFEFRNRLIDSFTLLSQRHEFCIGLVGRVLDDADFLTHSSAS